MHHTLLRESFFAEQIFFGKVQNTLHLPLFLQEKNLNHIRSQLHKLTWETCNISEFLFLENNKNRFDVFSVSDFGSYADDDIYSKIWHGIQYSAKHNARICERQFLVKKDPQIFITQLKRNKVLEEELEKKDASFIYSFVCGSLQ